MTAVAAGQPLPDGGDVLFGPIVSLSAWSVLVLMTVISLLKPRGPAPKPAEPVGALAPGGRNPL